jgi:tRNA 5-methylaminomethyl-2-thiouridine biosynthesis bifunctional protein
MEAITSSFLTKKQGLAPSSGADSFELYETEDGTLSFKCAEWEELGHSFAGALSETRYYLLEQSGLKERLQEQDSGQAPINLLELGFGLGWSWFLLSQITSRDIHLISFENHPDLIDWSLENNILRRDREEPLISLSQGACVRRFSYKKHRLSLVVGDAIQTIKELPLRVSSEELKYDFYFHDPFSPKTCPQFWTPEWFGKLSNLGKKEATLITYSSAGAVSRAMSDGGWRVEKIPGFSGKREAIRAQITKESTSN